MSAAIDAGSAKERARIAAGFLRRGAVGGRAFDACFEMNDGDEVKAELLRMAPRAPVLNRALRLHFRHWFVEDSRTP